jgi:chemosensory pili system protein ChpA (sensor histidine kinase/response regulator)
MPATPVFVAKAEGRLPLRPAAARDPRHPVRLPRPVAARDATRFGQGRADADMDLADAVDPDLFPIFGRKAAELMPQLGGALRQWAARPDNRSARDEVLRGLHTLKGSSRLAGALRLGELAHRMESEIEYLGSSEVPAVSDVEALLQRFDGMQANWDALRATGGVTTAAASDSASAVATETVDSTATMPAESADTAAQPVPCRTCAHTGVGHAAVTVLAPQRASAIRRARALPLLDRLVNQAGG